MIKPKKLKADFHMHTSEDPNDLFIQHSTTELIDKAAECGFDVLSITLHNKRLYNDYLKRYAEDRGILLIPGMEATIENKHILLINMDCDLSKIHEIRDLKRYTGEDTLTIAAHPFFPGSHCLGSKLEKNIEIFNAVEYCHFHLKRINFNEKAVQIARKYQLPMVGTSDTHLLSQFNRTFSLIEAEKEVGSVIEAIKKRHIEVVSEALTPLYAARTMLTLKSGDIKKKIIGRWK
jgi:hypothetical protein